MKPLKSGHLWVFRCQLLGGSLTTIVTFATKHFVRYLRHVCCLGCPLLGDFTVVVQVNAKNISKKLEKELAFN